MNTTIGHNNVVLNAYNAALARVKAIIDPVEQKAQMDALIWGIQKDAKVIAVFNVWRVQEMISRLKHFIAKKQLSNGNWYYRFNLPLSYTAFMAYARVDQLYDEFKSRIDEKGLVIEIHPAKNDKGEVIVNENGEVSFKLFAPRIIPRPTNNISFILNSTETDLVEWFAGNLPETQDLHIGGTFDIGRQWVRLGSYNPPKDGKHAHKGHPKIQKPVEGLANVGDVLEVLTSTDLDNLVSTAMDTPAVEQLAPAEDLTKTYDLATTPTVSDRAAEVALA